MHCAVRQCGHCQLGPLFICADGPVVTWTVAAPLLAVRAMVSRRRPTNGRGLEVRVVRRLPALAARLRGRAAGRRRSGADRLLPRSDAGDGRRTIRHLARRGLGHDRARRGARIKDIRAASRRLVTIGACATAGGVQALRNYSDVDDFVRIVYAVPRVTSRRCRRRRRSAPTSPSTSSSAAAPSTGTSCSTCSPPSSVSADRTSPATASASSASCVATSV